MNAKKPDYFKGGKLADKLNAWMDFHMDFVHAAVPLGEVNSPSGRMIIGGQGSGGGIIVPHNYTVKNASSGATPKIIVTPGNHFDSTGVATWIPTIGGITINTIPAPVLTVGSSDTLVWFKLTVNPMDGSGTTPAGAITALEIDSGTALPAATNTTVYQLCANIVVTITGGVASVLSTEGGVGGSQVTQACGITLLLGLQ